MIDAPVSGAEWGAKAAELVFMCGGAAGDLERVRPLLERMGKAVFHLGPLGAGHAMKCLNNLVTALNFLAVSEGLVIGKRYGLDPAAMVDVLDRSTGMSWISQTHIRQRVISRSFDDPFKLSLMLKDIGIAMQLARSEDVPAPLSALGQELWRAAGRGAEADASVSELARWVERMAATEISPAPSASSAMRVLVTGAAGFLGRALVHVLRVGHEVVATDRDDGDIADRSHVAHLFARPVDRIFHLAAIVSGAAEADFAAGQRVNLDATVHLLDCCRAQVARGGPVVRFVYASSIAVFGTPLPERIDDRTPTVPSLSYGTHKRVCELLVDDASRRGEHRRSVAAPARRRRPAGAAQRRALGLQQRPHPRAARRPGLRMPGRARGDDLGHVASRRRRQPAAPGRRRRGRARSRIAPSPRARWRCRWPRSSPRSRASTLPPRRAFATGAGPRSRRSSGAGRATPRSRAPTRSAWSARRRSTR